jgi:Holliday junction resolvasome RuvABC endonuclease subunit
MTRNQKAFGDFLVLKNEYIEWLKENTKGRVAIERMFILYNRDAYVTFAQKSEAIHFKLVWGGKC